MDGKVRVETEKNAAAPLAVVYYGESLGGELARQLRTEGLRARYVRTQAEGLPVWEEPDYVFYFGEVAEKWGKAKVFPIKIRGKIKEDKDWLEGSAKKIIKMAFSPNLGELLVLGGGAERFAGVPRARIIEQVTTALTFRKKHHASKKTLATLVILAIVFLTLSPFLWLGFSTIVGFSQVVAAVESLRKNDTTAAQVLSGKAMVHFAQAKEAVRFTGVVSPLFTERYFNFLDLGEKSADLVGRSSVLLPKAQNLVREVLGGSTIQETAQIRLELSPINQDLGFLEGQLGQFLTPRMVNFLSFFGISKTRVASYKREISRARSLVVQADEVLGVWGEIIPVNQKRTYLVVLQNSAELRPTGGFIGSYALVNFDNGRMMGFKIYDIYAADGRLSSHITPPDEILHYLGQTSWFMRDANWAADFPLTAKRLEWFLEKETGVVADGVIGVNLGVIGKLLAVTSQIVLPDQEVVTAKNFFEKAEFASEINFFPGSTQKPQFLANTAAALFAKLSSGADLDWVGLGSALHQAMVEKDLLFYFDSPTVQWLMAKNSWDGGLKKDPNFLMVVEANLGANKANYFVKRSLRVDSLIDKAGGLETTVVIKYRNDSPNASWPGGSYKNYLRFLVPEGTKLVSVDLGDKKEATISSLLTEDVLKAVAPDQFLVFRSLEQTLGENGTVTGAATAFGVLVEVPVQREKEVKFVYRPAYRMDFNKTQSDFRFVILKQPGTGNDSLDFALDYPSFLTPVWKDSPDKEVSLLALPQKTVYNTDLSKDRTIYASFNVKGPN